MTRLRLMVAVLAPVVVAGLLSAAGRSAAEGNARAACLGVRATIVGTAGGDLLRGTQKRDVIVALGGRDRVYGRGGDDLLCGGPGNDLLDGGPGRNRLHGGAGQDHCVRAIRVVGCDTPRRIAPAIAGVTLEGRRLSLAAFRGRPVFVNVWSSW